MARSATIHTDEEKLGFVYVLNQLQKDGILSTQQVAQLNKLIPKPDESVNPLILVAEQGLHSNTEPSWPLTLERLTQWLAEKTNFPYLRIDPLKIDVNNVTKFVSQAYATNLKILPVEVTAKELVATGFSKSTATNCGKR